MKENVTFDYDPMPVHCNDNGGGGHRIAKHVYTSANVLKNSTYYVLDAQGNTMSTYVREIVSSTIYFSQKEKYIYGSSRLGVLNDSIPLLGSQNSTYSQTKWTHSIGKRNYEISNHLGNVLAVISDKVLLKDAGTYNTSTGAYVSATLDNKTDWFLADILQASDYSPFGVQLSGRNFVKTSAKEYRMGFNGMEEDDEVKGEGNSYDYIHRFYDPRLGRFLRIDDRAHDFPWNSPYAFAENNVPRCIDLDGLEKLDMVVTSAPNTTDGKPGEATLTVTKAYSVVTSGKAAVPSSEKIDPDGFSKIYRKGDQALFVSALPTSTADAVYLSTADEKLAAKALKGDEKSAQKLKDKGVNYYVLNIKFAYSIEVKPNVDLTTALTFVTGDPVKNGVLAMAISTADVASEISSMTTQEAKDYTQFNRLAKEFRTEKTAGGAGTISSINTTDVILLNALRWSSDDNFEQSLDPTNPLAKTYSRTEAVAHEAGHNTTDLGHNDPNYKYSNEGLSSSDNLDVYPTKENVKAIISSPNNRSNLTTTGP